ncbi:MAG: 2,3-bisphosphoglycerate-independent phosphoglycerate mutase [Desulfarculaceae bacterium]|nr:2,3-bisphosphoglycerate-independent phosphoglycerate mutase [Desulfarculaceae bacterium]MCF8071882.1 2,3-bisphosphoglycerate-independent phosphoglycerate mutase [Desulfarculaceae bacterium]MCF8101432.1 2,3-bisphosphoglycerate-independent phosphoglycerate mutase [Desulfarculaceae bacterium]MCF8118198.1 2,3-bisphosphoglycerate-independent phosphoglycerate mutase [Desulfarculaceae bacterium]
MSAHAPVALIILDGWGINESEEGNAVRLAHTPFMDSLFADYPHTQLRCSGEAVGLPEGQMGNSEVGHLNLGAGRVVFQDITRINRAVASGEMGKNPQFQKAFGVAKSGGHALHLLGLVSDGGVHSLLTHLEAIITAAETAGVERIYIHAFLDGRDTPPDSGAGYLKQLEDFLNLHPAGMIASVGGRYWGMDRDKRWDRVKKAYDALVKGQGRHSGDLATSVEEAYSQGEYDEFVQPTVRIDEHDNPVGTIKDGDAVIFFNFRADRARELTWAFNDPDFDQFDVSGRPELGYYVCMTQYDEHLKAPVAFPPQTVEDTLAEAVAAAGKTQLHIAETEKYAHVTFFFNGGMEDPVPGEDRVLVPSPKEVDTYDQKPAMSAVEVTDEVLARIAADRYDLIVMNYANGDMVGHTGVLEAAMAAMETLDQCLARVLPALMAAGGRALVTADHGNAEQMIDPQGGGPYTAHTVSNPVPLILVDSARKDARLRGDGALCDVAPTVLELMGLPQPPVMTGKSLLLNPGG